MDSYYGKTYQLEKKTNVYVDITLCIFYWAYSKPL